MSVWAAREGSDSGEGSDIFAASDASWTENKAKGSDPRRLLPSWLPTSPLFRPSA